MLGPDPYGIYSQMTGPRFTRRPARYDLRGESDGAIVPEFRAPVGRDHTSCRRYYSPASRLSTDAPTEARLRVHGAESGCATAAGSILREGRAR
jgi:hypothetical protein